MIITDQPVDMLLIISLTLMLNPDKLPKVVLHIADGDLGLITYKSGLMDHTTTYTEQLTNRLDARLKQMKTGEDISFETMAQWIEQEKGPGYLYKNLVLASSSIDGNMQTATGAGQLIRVRSVEIPKVQMAITFPDFS